MAALNRGVLELTADVDDDGSEETGVFELVGDIAVTEEVQKDYWFDNTASGLINLTSEIDGFEIEARKGFFLDVGAGAHIFEIQFIGWQGATDSDGNAVKWGDGSGSFPADATQDEPLKQLQCFNKYLQLSTTDSRNPATLYIGEYADGTHGQDGAFDPLKVAIQGPSNSHDSAEEFIEFSGTFTALEVLELTQKIDIVSRTIRGNQQ